MKNIRYTSIQDSISETIWRARRQTTQSARLEYDVPNWRITNIRISQMIKKPVEDQIMDEIDEKH
jgi:hypothetical protein